MSDQFPVSHIARYMGRRFGRLVALSPTQRLSRGSFRWACRCDCGNVKLVRINSLLDGATSSCGCLYQQTRRTVARTHGMSRNGRSEYKIWQGMIQRCHNPNTPSYVKYGMRGIHVCQQWLDSFEQFYSDMGCRPHGTSLDRIDNYGPYSPWNCRWADLSTQARNSRKTPSPHRSIFKGVYWFHGKWQASIRHHSKGIHIGTFDTERDAALAYDSKAIELRGNNAVTNLSLGRL